VKFTLKSIGVVLIALALGAGSALALIYYPPAGLGVNNVARSSDGTYWIMLSRTAKEGNWVPAGEVD
jgi:hypothetical protein